MTTNKTFKCEFKSCSNEEIGIWGKLISHLNFVNRKQQLAVESDKKVSAKVERLEGVTEVEEGLGTDVDDDVVG